MESKNSHGRPPKMAPKKNHLLLIGINDYQHVAKLNNAEKDIEDFKTVLYEKYNFSETETIALIGSKATRKNIFAAFNTLRDRIAEGDNLVIYYSGHGHYDKTDDVGYWIPVEGEKNEESSYFSNSEIQVKLKSLKKAQHIFLISDSCFSRTLFNRDIARHLHKDHAQLEKDASRWGLTSGKGLVSDGRPGTNSPFAEVLLHYLRGSEKDFAIGDLMQAVKERVANQNYDQVPQAYPIIGTGHDGGEFVFRLQKDADTEAYQQAIAENTLAAYNAYLQQNYTKYRSDIAQRKTRLETAEREKRAAEEKEKKDFDILEARLLLATTFAQKIRLIQSFQQNYPKGNYAAATKKMLDEIREIINGSHKEDLVKPDIKDKKEEDKKGEILNTEEPVPQIPYVKIGGSIAGVLIGVYSLFFVIIPHFTKTQEPTPDPVVTIDTTGNWSKEHPPVTPLKPTYDKAKLQELLKNIAYYEDAGMSDKKQESCKAAYALAPDNAEVKKSCK